MTLRFSLPAPPPESAPVHFVIEVPDGSGGVRDEGFDVPRQVPGAAIMALSEAEAFAPGTRRHLAALSSLGRRLLGEDGWIRFLNAADLAGWSTDQCREAIYDITAEVVSTPSVPSDDSREASEGAGRSSTDDSSSAEASAWPT